VLNNQKKPLTPEEMMMSITSKKVKSMQQKTGRGQIRYNHKTCTYSVPDSILKQLQVKYPYDDIRAAIARAGRHTKGYSENARQNITADPGRVLEFDLECWLFRPEPQQQARTLTELAQQIKLCPTFVREALTGEIDMKLADRDLAKFYPRYRELGGTGFEPANNAADGLVHLLELCGEKKRLPRLQEIDVGILKYLNTAELAKRQADLETKLGVPRKTVEKRLKYLRELGLIFRPQGRTGGDAISKQGRNFLKTL
jgi:hypothetical protein